MISKKIKLKAPLAVSPIIKFVRWSFLLSGAIYGFNRRNSLELTEKGARILREKALEKERILREKANIEAYYDILNFFGGLVGAKPLEKPSDC